MLEISDLIVSWDPVTGERRPVRRADVATRLRAVGDRRAARIVERMPAPGGVLDQGAVDRLLVRAHTELQRLSEELHMAERIGELLVAAVAAVRAQGGSAPLRVVDIGCGLGFVVRALAVAGVLGPGVELVGVDANGALVAEAARLAEDERIDCRFVRGDAFALAEDATVYISTGLLHHVPAAELAAFFAAQDRSGTMAFVHYDLAPTRLAPFGAWLFHRARMREPLGRHDGVVSARRAHHDRTLLAAASHAGSMRTFLFEATRYTNPFCAAMRPVIGLRPQLVAPFRRALRRRARELV